MDEGYFVKVYEATSIDDVIMSIQWQKKHSKKKLQFYSIQKILLTDNEFQHLLHPIVQSNELYCKFSCQSIIRKDGLLNCITLVNTQTDSQLIVYTGSRTFPQYVSFKVVDNE